MNTYRYATDAETGTVSADSLECAYDAKRAEITDAMIEDGATLWVEGNEGRITMGVYAE